MSMIPEQANIIHTYIPSIEDIKNNISSFQIFEHDGIFYGQSHSFLDETDPSTTISYNEIIISESIETEKNVIILGINSNEPINGKIDTGAECCSLNAQDIKTKEDVVEFTFKDSRYRMDLSNQHEIKTADGGSELRPVVSVSCKVDGNVYKDILMNLNDRGDLGDLLIGMNLIDHLNITGKPSLEEVISKCKEALF